MIAKWFFAKVLEKAVDKSVDGLIASLFETKADRERIRLQLTACFNGHVEIKCFNRRVPEVDIIGELPLDADLKRSAAIHKRRLKSMGRPDDLCAVLEKEPNWQADPVLLQARTADFSKLCALRDNNHKPKIITANALVICKETEEVILHRRGRRENGVEAYPEMLHTFGGAYISTKKGGVDSDRGGLGSTATRELFEETQAVALDDKLPPHDVGARVHCGLRLC